jgi:hypothetical protein
MALYLSIHLDGVQQTSRIFFSVPVIPVTPLRLLTLDFSSSTYVPDVFEVIIAIEIVVT